MRQPSLLGTVHSHVKRGGTYNTSLEPIPVTFNRIMDGLVYLLLCKVLYCPVLCDCRKTLILKK